MFSKFTLKHAFEPKTIKVRDYWLSGLMKDEEGHIAPVEIVRPEGPRPTTLDVAAKKLYQEWEKLGTETKKNILTPIWCLHETSPLIQGVKSLLVTDLVDSLSSQISSLKLEEPIEFVTRKVAKRKKELGKTIIDLTSQQMVILGDALGFLNYLRIIGSRLTLQQKDDRHTILEWLRRILTSHSINPLTSTLVIAWFGTIFIFETALVSNRLLQTKPIHIWELFPFVLSSLSFIFFLIGEAFINQIVAFEAQWTRKANHIAWLIFILFLMILPIFIFGAKDAHIFFDIYRIFSLAIIVLCSITTLGQIYFGSGLTKWGALKLWIIFGILIAGLPYLPK